MCERLAVSSAAFRVCSSGYSDGTTAALAYDADGRLASLVNLATLTVVGYSYSADGQLAAEAFPGGGRRYTGASDLRTE